MNSSVRRSSFLFAFAALASLHACSGEGEGEATNSTPLVPTDSASGTPPAGPSGPPTGSTPSVTASNPSVEPDPVMTPTPPSATPTAPSSAPTESASVTPTTEPTVPMAGMGGMGGMPSMGGGGAGGSAPGAGGMAEGGGGSTVEASLATLEEVITALGCSGSDCHGGNEFNALDLRVGDDLLTNLTSTISGCEDLPVVDPGNPEGSALIRLLKGPCGDIQRMPAGCFQNEFENNCVPDDYIAAIEQWVADGALPE